MRKKPKPPAPAMPPPLAPAPVPTSLKSRIREWLGQSVASFLIGPVMGMMAGFCLLFGGIFLDVAWTVGPKVLLESRRYHSFTGIVNGRIVEGWAALDFDPATLGQSRRWFAYARISA